MMIWWWTCRSREPRGFSRPAIGSRSSRQGPQLVDLHALRTVAAPNCVQVVSPTQADLFGVGVEADRRRGGQPASGTLVALGGPAEQ